MKIIRKNINDLSPNDYSQIDKFIENHKGLVFHETSFNRIASKHFKTKLEYYICSSEDDFFLGICPIHIKQKGLLCIKYAKILYDVPYGGWVYKNIEIKDLVNELINSNFRESLQYFSNIQVNGLDLTQFKGLNFTVLKTSIIDLNNNEYLIWGNYLNPKKRNKVRKAIKSGIQVVSKPNKEGFNQIWPIIENLHTKLGFNHLGKDYYLDVLTSYFKMKQANILLALKDDKVISGIVLIGNKYFMHYWKGASLPEAKNEGQGELLQWEAIKWSKSVGCSYYDLCVVEKDRLPHIYEFKTGISNNIVPFYSFTKKSLFYKIINRLQKWIIKK